MGPSSFLNGVMGPLYMAKNPRVTWDVTPKWSYNFWFFDSLRSDKIILIPCIPPKKMLTMKRSRKSWSFLYCEVNTTRWNPTSCFRLQLHKNGVWLHVGEYVLLKVNPGIPTTIKTMGVNIITIVYLRVLIIQIGSTIILMVVEA